MCKKLRGVPMEQMMSSLPYHRLQETPPFTHCGLDVFGPFMITEGKATRQSCATKKLWALLLTCMASRAVHIEPLPGLDTSTMLKAISRFSLMRGSAKHYYCDRGTNFVAAQKTNQSFVEFDSVAEGMVTSGVTWHFNPAHSSHHGGVWERKVGAIRRVLEASLFNLRTRYPTRDEMTTFLAEAISIVNNTPMWTISSDPKALSPAMLLTLRDDPNPPPLDQFTEDDLLAYGKSRWRRGQYLAECFWKT